MASEGLPGDQVELVAFDVGEGRPAGLVSPQVAEPLGAQAQQTPGLGVAVNRHCDQRIAHTGIPSRTDVGYAGVRRSGVEAAGAHVPPGPSGSDSSTAAVSGDDRAGDVAGLGRGEEGDHGRIRPACLPVRVASYPGTFLTAGRGAREIAAADSGQRYDACHERDDGRDQQDAVQAGGEGGPGDRSHDLPGGRGQPCDHVTDLPGLYRASDLRPCGSAPRLSRRWRTASPAGRCRWRCRPGGRWS
jgi:hypothetical protein